MIAVIGKPNVTLKRLMVEDGFPHLNNYAARGRRTTQQLDGVFNCSYTPTQMRDYVYRRWEWLRDDLPIINKNIIPNKMEAQHAMAANSELAEHILETSTTWQDINYNDNRWILKPFASQGGAGIRRYEGGRVPQGFYLQKDANKYREFRAHVGLWLENPVFTIQEKKPKPELWADIFGDPDLYTWPLDDEDERNGLPLTWNIESGFYFRRSTTPENRADKVVIYPLFRRIEEVAVRAVKALGYQFGAVDILMDESRHLWVTEVNSHPAIKNDESKRIYLLALEPLKEMSKIDIYNVIQQATTRITRRTFVRGEGFI